MIILLNSIFTDNTKIIDIYYTDFNTMFTSFKHETIKQLPFYEKMNFFALDDEKKEKIIIDLLHIETGVPKKSIRWKNWFNIDGKWFYYKDNIFLNRNINELLGEIVSEYFELDTVHYGFAKLHFGDCRFREGLISENFCTPDKNYYTCADFGHEFNSSSDFDILYKIRSLCPSDDACNLLLHDLKKFIVRDFSTLQRDRSYKNFLFYDDNGFRLDCLYDYEDSFCDSNNTFYRNSLITLDLDNNKTKDVLRNDLVFQELLYKLVDMDVMKMKKIIEERHDVFIDEKYFGLYKFYINSVKDVVRKRNLIK